MSLKKIVETSAKKSVKMFQKQNEYLNCEMLLAKSDY